MQIQTIQDRKILESYFRQDLSLHAYSLGDLDDPFWADTTCLGLITPQGLRNVSLIYSGPGLPVLLIFSHQDAVGPAYIQGLMEFLPEEFYAHLSPGIVDHFRDQYQIKDYGEHIKMDLEFDQFPQGLRLDGVEPLTTVDLPDLEQLYQIAYPESAFDPRLLETGLFFGCRQNSDLISAGGIHVYSEKYRLATLGTIATHPQHRQQGLGRQVSARICQELMGKVDFIGLNVRVDNFPGLAIYQSLGFQFGSKYSEFSLKKTKKGAFSP